MPKAQDAPSRPLSADAAHGSARLGDVCVTAYNSDFKTQKGYVGDRVSLPALRAHLADARAALRRCSVDPFDGLDTAALSKKRLDRALFGGDPAAAGLVHGAVEELARELASITIHFRRLAAWKDVQRIVVGGGLRDSRIGEIAIGRATVLLQRAGHAVALQPVRHHPDEAALLGAVHLIPPRLRSGCSAILAIDIGGSNVRVGLVRVRARAGRVPRATLLASERWRYADERRRPARNALLARTDRMLRRMIRQAARRRLDLAPLVGVACPGVILADGSIVRGGLNLPGNWQSRRFNLPREIRRRLPRIGGAATHVVMHNDAVVHGLSEAAHQTASWGVFTIGTGFGSAVLAHCIPRAGLRQARLKAQPD